MEFKKLVLLLFWGISLISCVRKYDIYLEDVEELEDYNNTYIDWDFSINKHNWTTNVMDGEINLLNNMPSNTIVHVIGYEKRGNAYHPSVVDMVMSICQFLNEPHVKKIFLSKSNFPKQCPVMKGNYKVNMMTVSSEDLPQRLSGQYWMMRFIVQLEEAVLGDLKIYANIDWTKGIRTSVSI